jgi:hypothetical protein
MLKKIHKNCWIKYCSHGDQIKEDKKTGIKKDERGGPCSMHVGVEKCKILVRKYEGKGRVRRSDDDIKIDLRWR